MRNCMGCLFIGKRKLNEIRINLLRRKGNKMSLAKVNGLFRLTRDAELRFGNNGTAILKMGLACSEKFGDKETQLFIDATVFGKQAEIINEWAGTKGTQIFLSGKLQTETWVDQTNNQNRSKISMIVESFDFVSKGRDNSDEPKQPYKMPEPHYEKAHIPQNNLSDIPF